ncbi:head protein [Stigmatella sp. ncwal1]|uniref:Head protein n=1 Tax=Stigmatella ashevillensis TaxID=2995309 RepID=A0ABT5DE38_9BACT|nr:head protein [Stigmatella ashevillena]MDC0711944.1 head protein [Stigmatella ashevillena]
MKIGELSLESQELLGRLRESAQSTEEKERFLAAMDALKFIAATGQSLDFEDYRNSLDAKAPPLAIEAFKTREEADAWLKGHPRPPHLAYVLIAGEYHVVMHVPELNRRRLISHPVLEFYLADMIRDGIPAPVATFDTREEAGAWLNHQPEPPRQVFIQIAGEPYLVVYHHRINLRAFYPTSMAAMPEHPGETEN